MTFFKSIFAVALLTLSFSAHAINLDSARSSGKVKELPSGFIESTTNSPEVNALVKKVNAGRKKHYESVAKKNGTSIGVVGKTAAEKIKQKLKK